MEWWVECTDWCLVVGSIQLKPAYPAGNQGHKASDPPPPLLHLRLKPLSLPGIPVLLMSRQLQGHAASDSLGMATSNTVPPEPFPSLVPPCTFHVQEPTGGTVAPIPWVWPPPIPYCSNPCPPVCLPALLLSGQLQGARCLQLPFHLNRLAPIPRPCPCAPRFQAATGGTLRLVLWAWFPPTPSYRWSRGLPSSCPTTGQASLRRVRNPGALGECGMCGEIPGRGGGECEVVKSHDWGSNG